MAYIHCILHIHSLQELAGFLSVRAPEKLDSETGSIIGFDHTPMQVNGAESLTYVSMSDAEAMLFRHAPGVSVLAETPYTAEGTADRVYAALFADPAATEIYDRIYPRTPTQWTDEDGVDHISTPPLHFGKIA